MNFLGMLNSNAIATVTNVLLSSLLIFFTVRISKKSCKQEKEIHNRNVLIAREQRMFNIYHVFANCGRVLKTDEITELAKLNILIDTKEFVKEIMKCRNEVTKALDEARLICGECKLVKVLENARNKFFKLSEIEISLLREQSQLMLIAIPTIEKEFPEIYPLTIQNILSNSQASQRINQLTTTPKTKEYDAGVEDYWKNVLSYENFDKYFEPFLVREEIRS